MTALGKFRPEELHTVARHNAELAESIQALLPKLDHQRQVKGGGGGVAKAPATMFAAPAPATGSYGGSYAEEPLYSQGLTSSM